MKSAIEWDQSEKQKVVDFLSEVFHDHAFISSDAISEIFFQSIYLDGETYLASFRDGEATAIAAMIVEAIERDQIVYFNTCYCMEGEEESLKKLIVALEHMAIDWGAKISKIGLRKENRTLGDRLLPAVGYHPTYRIVQMGKEIRGEVGLPAGFYDQMVAADSLEQYVLLHNEAFLNSPNNSEMSLGEAQELFERQDQGATRLGFLVHNGETVGTYLLSLEKGVLWSDAITINPSHQGKGWGKVLMQNIENQAASMANSLHLLVVDSNEVAFHLYQGSEFLEEKVYSEWFEKKL
jgi:ribosomal protein S18 acetylase RimI-like enzyme